MAERSPQLDRARCLSEVFGEGRPRTLAETLLLLKLLALEVRAWHERGRIHRAINSQQVMIDEHGQPRLEPANGPCCFGVSAFDAELCPPELAQVELLEVPEDREAAAALLAGVEPGIDPRRIDVFQLGTLCWRLLSGQSIRAYMFDPKAKAAVPPPLLAALDRMLGYDTMDRLTVCDPLIEVLDEVLRGEQAAVATPPTGTARDRGFDTPPQGSAAEIPRDDTSPTLMYSLSAASQPASPLPFARLSHFRIVRCIGRGGMGEVYEGYDESLDRRVAIKVLPPELAKDQDFVKRFHAEASAAGKINHPNVITVHAIGEDAGYYFFAMPYVDGQSLSERLAREHRLSPADAMEIVRQCLGGLQAAHALGLIHRDIKPANILLEAGSGRAVLVDFGLVRCQSRQTEMTATGIIMGTVDYIAPEQARSDRVDHRSDLYSLGVVLYRMLAGRLPFESDSSTAMMFQHAYEQPFPLEQAAPGVPGPVVEIVARLMAKDPADRYQDCAAALADVRAWQEGRPLAALPAPEDRPAADVLAEVPPLPAEPDDGRGGGAIRDLAATLFRRHAPKFLQDMQGTMVQVDAALASHRRHRERLAQLLAEARRAGIAEHVEDLELQLAKADASLAQLGSQRDVLLARLRTAEAQQGLHRVRRPHPRRLVLATAALAIGVFVWLLFHVIRPAAKPLVTPAPTRIESRAATTASAARVSPPVSPPLIELTNSIGMPLVLIPSGEFDMGATPEEAAWTFTEAKKSHRPDDSFIERVQRESQHRVKITRPFHLGMYDVTQGEYEKVMGVNPSAFTEKQMDASAFHPPLLAAEVSRRPDIRDRVAGKNTRRHPVETINWEEAVEFCRRLSALPAERTAGRVYRLPTEAEWEYACRAGTTSRWYSGDDEASLADAAWFGKNSGGMTHPVGEKKPNAWGLYDMHGNVWQWCTDLFSKDSYTRSDSNDPAGPSSGVGRVLRGGGWSFKASVCRAASRAGIVPTARNGAYGFRVAMDIASKPTEAVSAVPPAELHGRFYVARNGRLFLYRNGQSLGHHYHLGVSDETPLAAGDTIVIHVQRRNRTGSESFRLAFVSNDNRWLIAFRASDFHEFADDLAPKDITAAAVRAARAQPGSAHPQPHFLGRAEPRCQQEWAELHMPAEAEAAQWMSVSDGASGAQCACVIGAGMLSAIRAGPPPPATFLRSTWAKATADEDEQDDTPSASPLSTESHAIMRGK